MRFDKMGTGAARVYLCVALLLGCLLVANGGRGRDDDNPAQAVGIINPRAAMAPWPNATCVSDGYAGVYWNDQSSSNTAVMAGPDGAVHVVWEEYTVGPWGGDGEIFHAVLRDTEDPVVTIHAPVPGQAFVDIPRYSVAVHDNFGVGSVWCTLDGGATNHTLAGIGSTGAGTTNITVACNGTAHQTLWDAAPLGSVTIVVYVRDLAGNLASDTVGVVKNLPTTTIFLLIEYSMFGVLFVAFVYVEIIAPRRKARGRPQSP